jgi:dolichol-phosphate mannosyltransferase
MLRYDSEMRKIDLSVIVPCFNEEKSVPLFLDQLIPTLKSLRISSEIIFVDDGSTDGTWEIIKNQKDTSFAKVRGIKFDRNYGQMSAIEAGIRKSRADFVLTIDVDLQQPVRYIPTMWELRNEHKVIAMRQTRRHDPKIKSILSRLFYSLLKRITGFHIVANVSDFRLMSRETVERIIPSFAQGNVIRFLLPQLGVKQWILDYDVEPRAIGNSKYSLRKMSFLAKNSILTTSNRLLHLSIYLALMSIFFATIVLTYTLFIFLTDNAILGWASILGTMLVLFSATFSILGIIGVYIGRIIELLIKRPGHYIEEEA